MGRGKEEGRYLKNKGASDQMPKEKEAQSGGTLCLSPPPPPPGTAVLTQQWEWQR